MLISAMLRNLQQTAEQSSVIKYIFFSKYTMADSQQVTSQTPTTKTKNPKRVAAGKAIAEKTRLAREAQKKALDGANAIIANKKAPEATLEVTPEATPEAAAAITTTQWLSGISIFLSIVGIYYKREEIKALFAKKPPPVEPKKEGRIRNMD